MNFTIDELREIEEVIEKDIYPKAKESGKLFYKAFGDKGKTQANNLKNVAYSYDRFMNIENFVKNQMSKCKENEKWLYKGDENIEVGEKILNDLEYISEVSKELNKKFERDSKYELDIKMRIARSYIDTLVIHYSYLNVKN